VKWLVISDREAKVIFWPLAVSSSIFVHFNLSQFAGVLQLLREERPVYLYEFGPSNAGPMTGGEPTGEEEGLSG
jgi:hypothetical protein